MTMTATRLTTPNSATSPVGPAGGHGGGQPGEQDVEAAFEFGGAVVGGQDGGQAAEQGEVADREPVQAEPQQVVGLVGADGEFLQLVQDVAVQEPNRAR